MFGARGWPGFPTACVVAFVAALAVGRVAEDIGLFATLGVIPFLPALISVLHGEYYWNFNPIWEAWVFGFLLSRSDLRRWHAPARWRLPLIFWALIVATSWPVIVAREADLPGASWVPMVRPRTIWEERPGTLLAGSPTRR